jgi:hypothetical protein
VVVEINADNDVVAGLLDGVATRLTSPDAAQAWRAEHRHDSGDVGDDDPLFAALAPEQGCPDERDGDEPVEQVGGCFGAALVVGDRDRAEVWASDDVAAEVFADFRAEPAEERDPALAPTSKGARRSTGRTGAHGTSRTPAGTEWGCRPRSTTSTDATRSSRRSSPASSFHCCFAAVETAVKQQAESHRPDFWSTQAAARAGESAGLYGGAGARIGDRTRSGLGDRGRGRAESRCVRAVGPS